MGTSDWKLILVAAAAAGAACAEASYTQDGADWLRTVTREAPAHTQLMVSARAKIVLRGATDSKIVYKLVQRVRARSEVQARKLMPDAFGIVDYPGDVTRM